MRNFILLFVNGQQHRVTGQDAFLTLSDFLRLRLKLTGTKIVCSEGDCGSCSVLVAKIDSNGFTYRPIDSCIRFVFQHDGHHIVTVEGIGDEDDLSRIQKAMVDCHGSQCGFCTPGFVVAMTGLVEENNSLSEQEWRTGLTGNLCRCTGYSPIMQAASQCDASNTQKVCQRYPDNDLVETVMSVDDVPILIESEETPDATRIFCPKTINEAVDFLAEHPCAKIVAGSTDVGVQFNKGHIGPTTWLDLNRISELAGVHLEAQTIVAGARATWTELEQLTRGLVPAFHKIVSIFGSPQIRHVGTIGGNLINASPIADSIPFLMICDAELDLVGASGTRTVNINKFYRGYKQFDLQPEELLARIRIPLPDTDALLRLYKVSRRRDLDISTFTAAVMMHVDGTTITTAKLAYGAVGPVVLRLPKTEQFLIGKPFDLDSMQLAGDIAVDEITPISDVRGGADFRLQLARNVLLKFFHQAQLEQVPA